MRAVKTDISGTLILLKKKRVLTVITILIIAGGILLAWALTRNHPTQTVSTTPAPTSTQLVTANQKAAAQSLSQKDYSQAEMFYMAESAQANSNQQAKEALLEAIQKIPDQYVTWDLYDSLAVVAKNLNDKTLEISSLQKALAKAQQPGSGAKTSIITIYQQELKSLGTQ